jgi:Cutinase
MPRMFPTRLLAAGLALVAGALLFPARADAAPAAGGAQADPADCPSLYLHGVRGTGEPAGLGLPIGAIADELDELLPGEVEARANAYPASGIDLLQGLVQYKASVQQGRSNLVADLQAMESACPDADVAIVGYSQGADVVRRGLIDHGSAAGYKVVLLGDPNLKGTETTIEMVDENGNPVPTGRSGVAHLPVSMPLWPIPAFPADGDTMDDDVSVCRVNDPICGNGVIPNWDLANGPHNSYHLDAPELAADIAAWSTST